MADIAPVDANVELMASGSFENAVAGEALARLDCVYKHTDGKVYKVDVDDVAKDSLYALAFSKASADGDPVVLIKSGGIDVGAALTKGQRYYCSGLVNGKIGVFADLVALDAVVEIGYAVATDHLHLDFTNTGITI